MTKRKIIVVLIAYLCVCIIFYCSEHFGKMGMVISTSVIFALIACYINEVLYESKDKG